MGIDSAVPEVPVSVVDQLEARQRARRVWGLYKGRWPIATLVLISLSVGVSVIWWQYPSILPGFLYSSGYQIWGEYKWLGILGSTFLHANLAHLVFNCYWLWLFGRMVEIESERVPYLFFAVGSAWICGAIEIAIDGDPGVGLSGFVYALFGYMLVNRTRVPAYANILVARTIISQVIWLFVCIALTHAGAMRIANGAHFAGFAFGCGVAFFLGRRCGRRSLLLR